MTLDEFKKLYGELKRLIKKEDDVDLVEESDWEDDGKYQHCSVVYKSGEDYFRVNLARSGSYWNDYEYQDPEFEQVEPFQHTITGYRPIAK